MQRREVLRLIATGTALQLAPGKWLAFSREVRALLAESSSLRTVTPHQDATLKALADMIIPRTDTPSATDAGVSQFIDLVLTECYDVPERTHFLDGLSDVDAQSRTLFNKNFTDCSTEQKGKLLTELGAKMLEGTVPSSRRLSVQRPAPPKTNFYADFRRLALTAYYTSEPGATQALHYEVIPEQYQGCNISPAKEPKQP
jgi:gluconate 2-dehydrogenase gamma chain